MPSSEISRADSCRGAAVVELAVLLVILVPLMFVVPAIGKLVDLRQTAVQAGRYATWQATVAAAGQGVAAGVQERFFASPEAPLSSSARIGGSSVLWGDVANGQQGLPERTAIRIDESSVATSPWQRGVGDLEFAGSVGSAIESAGQLLGGDDWDIGETSLTRAEVAVDVRSNGWFDDLAIGCGEAGGCVREGGVILVDGWSAADDQQAEDRVRALVPAQHLQPIGDLLSRLGAIPILRELRSMDGMFGHVDVQPLPAHADHGLDTYEEH